MAKPTLLPDPTCLHLRLLDASETAIKAVVTTTSEETECPVCHRRSARIHSRYVRTVADLPWMGCAVRLELHVRRYISHQPGVYAPNLHGAASDRGSSLRAAHDAAGRCPHPDRLCPWWGSRQTARGRDGALD